MRNLTERVTFGMVGAVGGLTGVVASTGACGSSGCVSCFGCAGMGLMLVGVTLLKRVRGIRHGQDTNNERCTENNNSSAG